MGDVNNALMSGSFWVPAGINGTDGYTKLDLGSLGWNGLTQLTIDARDQGQQEADVAMDDVVFTTSKEECR